MIKVFGLKNCDTCRKALKWMDMVGIKHQFFDVRANGVTRADIEFWISAVGWTVLLNQRGTTWRMLEIKNKKNLNEESVVRLLVDYPALIKRPIFVEGRNVIVGFKEKQKAEILGSFER